MPEARTNKTNRARPSLASQALKVNSVRIGTKESRETADSWKISLIIIIVINSRASKVSRM